MKLNKKGFTLMEMLIVVAIIAILVAIAIPTFSGALIKAREAADEANVRSYYAEVLADNLLNDEEFPSAYAGATLNYADKLSWDLADDTLTITYTATKIDDLELTAEDAMFED